MPFPPVRRGKKGKSEGGTIFGRGDAGTQKRPVPGWTGAGRNSLNDVLDRDLPRSSGNGSGKVGRSRAASVEDPAQAEDAQGREQHVDGDVRHGQQEQILEYILGAFRYFLWRFMSILYVFMNFSESV